MYGCLLTIIELKWHLLGLLNSQSKVDWQPSHSWGLFVFPGLHGKGKKFLDGTPPTSCRTSSFFPSALKDKRKKKSTFEKCYAKIKTRRVKVLVAQLCPTFCDPTDCSPPGSSVHGILQARILEWSAISFSRDSSQFKDQTWVSHTAGRFFTI